MRIQTPRESRREIVGRISEHLGIPARATSAPGFAYTIGEITGSSDGGIVSGNDALLESLEADARRARLAGSDPSMNRPRDEADVPKQAPSADTSRRCD